MMGWAEPWGRGLASGSARNGSRASLSGSPAPAVAMKIGACLRLNLARWDLSTDDGRGIWRAMGLSVNPGSRQFTKICLRHRFVEVFAMDAQPDCCNAQNQFCRDSA